MSEVLVRAASGYAFELARGRRFRVVDVAGQQVSDLVVFRRDDPGERFSPGNTRKLTGRLKLGRGGVLYSTRCRPLVRITEDTVGEHDFLFSSCSPYDYPLRFALTTSHASCLAILAQVLAPHGPSSRRTDGSRRRPRSRGRATSSSSWPRTTVWWP